MRFSNFNFRFKGRTRGVPRRLLETYLFVTPGSSTNIKLLIEHRPIHINFLPEFLEQLAGNYKNYQYHRFRKLDTYFRLRPTRLQTYTYVHI